MNPVTVTITAANYTPRLPFKEGEFINLGKNMWSAYFTRQRIKNRRMVGRLLKIEFIPKLIVKEIAHDKFDYTVTVKPHNF